MSELPAFDPTTPFIGRMLGGFKPSFMIRLKAKINGNGRGIIDFMNNPTEPEIVFHISMRPQDNVIVRNHYEKGEWGEQERRGHCLINSNETFEIVILAEFHTYKISVNSQDLGSFRHRLPLSWVEFIRVSGDLTIEHVIFEQDSRSAQEQKVLNQDAVIPSAKVMPILELLPVHAAKVQKKIQHVPLSYSTRDSADNID